MMGYDWEINGEPLTVSCDLEADNPGQWMIHCHNTFHAEAGMATIPGYHT